MKTESSTQKEKLRNSEQENHTDQLLMLDHALHLVAILLDQTEIGRLEGNEQGRHLPVTVIIQVCVLIPLLSLSLREPILTMIGFLQVIDADLEHQHIGETELHLGIPQIGAQELDLHPVQEARPDGILLEEMMIGGTG
jgi:hypothetical protein